MALQNNDMKPDAIESFFFVYRLVAVLLLIVFAGYLFIDSSSLSQEEKTKLFYEEEDPSYGITIDENDKSSFESLTSADITDQYERVRNALTIDRPIVDTGYQITKDGELGIDAKKIGVENPFIYANSKGNEYKDDQNKAFFEKEEKIKEAMKDKRQKESGIEEVK